MKERKKKSRCDAGITREKMHAKGWNKNSRVRIISPAEEERKKGLKLRSCFVPGEQKDQRLKKIRLLLFLSCHWIWRVIGFRMSSKPHARNTLSWRRVCSHAQKYEVKSARASCNEKSRRFLSNLPCNRIPWDKVVWHEEESEWVSD